MKTTRAIHQTFALSAASLACLMLTACSSVYGPHAKQSIDLDKLLQSNPPAASNGSSAQSKLLAHVETRQDPTSGLRVAISPAALSAPPVAPVDGDATSATSTPKDVPATGVMPAAAAAADQIAQTPGDSGAPPGAVRPPPKEAQEAIGAPTDPLNPDKTLDLADATATQDLWGRLRRGYSLPALDTALVAEHERWYASRPDYVQRMTERASRYLYHVVGEIERRQMPTELALLPFIESAFNPQAMSSVRASGMWQFMPATGKTFELKQNLFRDDRRDVLASTRAALDYLQRLNKQFGDWHLALAAYNWGEGNVQKAINRNARQGLPTDYLSLNMPPETRNYVPKLHAIRNIVLHPESFNLSLTPIENHPYFVSVPIQRDMDAALASRLAGLPLDEFKALNPSLNKPVILAAGTPQVLLPYDNASLFVHNLGAQKGPLASWTAWVVPRTMRPAEAARQVGMNEASLRDINHIPPKMLVKAGSTLLVPRSVQREQDVSEALADNAMMALAPDLPPMRRNSLKAGKRDTVAAIARRYRVSAQQVALWNRTSANATFKRGQTIVVFVPVRSNSRMASASAQHGKPVVVASRGKQRMQGRVVASASRNMGGNRGASRATRPSMSRNSRVRVASAR